MNILLAAPSAHCIGWHLAQAFEELGHAVEALSDDTRPSRLSWYAALASSPFRGSAEKALYRHKRAIGAELRRRAEGNGADLVLVVQGDYFLREDIRGIRERGIPVVNWIVRDPVRSEFFDPLRVINLSEYSLLFIADESWLPCVYFFDRKVVYLPLAGDAKAFSPAEREKDIDILYVGNLFPSSPDTTSGLVHARALARLLTEGFRVHALARGMRRIRHFIPGLEKIALLPYAAAPREINEAYQRANIVLSLSPLDFKKDPGEDVFAAALGGAFQITERKDNLSRLFPAGVPSFGSLAEMVAHAKEFLEHESRRRELALKARETAMQNHTFVARAKAILREVGFGGRNDS